jgi:hypothetical protein
VTAFRLLVPTLLLLTACSMNQRMVQVEHTLDAGSEAWSEVVDLEVEKCRAKNLATEPEREACIAPTNLADEVVAVALTAAVVGLRAYWIGVAIGETPKELQKHVAEVIDAIDDLPLEHFGGLRKLAGVK